MRRWGESLMGLVGGVVALPVIVVLAVAGAIVFRGNPFFVQERIGRGGKPFTFVKLRTLPKDAPAYADKYELEAVPVSRFGRFLRGTHLDELPQVIHVILGQMSLVGPRPEMPFLHRQMEPKFAKARVAVRPGWTGLWQISADAHKLIGESPQYDLFYLRYRTLRMDAWIIWRTAIGAVRSTSGVRIDDVPRRVCRRAAADLAIVDGGRTSDASVGVAQSTTATSDVTPGLRGA